MMTTRRERGMDGPKRRLVRSLTTFLAVLGFAITSIGVATPAQAATICNPYNWNYEVRASGAGIGNLIVKTNVCMSGTTMTSSTASVAWVANPLGTFAGWKYQQISGASRTSTGPNLAAWSQQGNFKLCVPTKWSPLCSYGNSYKVSFIGYASNFVGPPMSPVFKCMNSYCTTGMTFAYKSQYRG